MIIQIPFAGFYESKFSQELDYIESQYLEENPEYANDFWRFSNHCHAYEAIAPKYAGYFNDWLSDEVGFPVRLEFSDMSSPREYNFETDRIFCRIPDSSVERLFAQVDKDELRKVMRERHKSRDGFISHYDYQLEYWPESPLEWDHNQLMTLLIVCIPDFDDWNIYYSMVDSNAFDYAWDSCVDWESWEAFKREQDEEKEANDKRAKPLPRCEHTLDLFGGY